jgi:hypothetical protein
MGHRDFATTLIYADYQTAPGEAAAVEEAFARNDRGNDASDAEANSRTVNVLERE